MELTCARVGSAHVLTLSGRLDSGATPDFEQQCLRYAQGESPTLVLDFTALEYLSSAGLRVILSAGKETQSRQGKLVLCVPEGPVRKILEISGFLKLFPVCSNLSETTKYTGGGFKLHAHREWDVDILTVFGRVDAERAPELEEAGRKILDNPFQKLLLNMSAVDYLSSAGLCALLNLAKLADAKKGRMFVCSPAPTVRQILKLSGFDKILKIRDSVQDALVE